MNNLYTEATEKIKASGAAKTEAAAKMAAAAAAKKATAQTGIKGKFQIFKRRTVAAAMTAVFLLGAAIPGIISLVNLPKNLLASTVANAQFTPDLNKLMPGSLNYGAASDTVATTTAYEASYDTTGLGSFPAEQFRINNSYYSGGTVIRDAKERIEYLEDISKTDQAAAAGFIKNCDHPDTWRMLFSPEDFIKYQEYTGFAIGTALGKYYVAENGAINVLFYFTGTNPGNKLKKRIIVSGDGDTVEVFTDYQNGDFWVETDKSDNFMRYIPYIKNIRDADFFAVEETKNISFNAHLLLTDYSRVDIGTQILRNINVTSYKKSGDSFEGAEATYQFNNYNDQTMYCDLEEPRLSGIIISFLEGDSKIYNSLGATINFTNGVRSSVTYNITAVEGETGKRFTANLTQNNEWGQKTLSAQFTLNHFEGVKNYFYKPVQLLNHYSICAVELINGGVYEWPPADTEWPWAGGRLDFVVYADSQGRYQNLANAYYTYPPESESSASEALITACRFPDGLSIALPGNFSDLDSAAGIVANKTLLGIDDLAYNSDLLLKTVYEDFLWDKFTEFVL